MGRSLEGQTEPPASIDAFVLRLRVLQDTKVRAGAVLELLAKEPVAAVAPLLDGVCARAERGDERAREALVAIVDALALLGAAPPVQRLREEAAGAGLEALDRLLGPAPGDAEDPLADAAPKADGKTRPLTLGERKFLARTADRAALLRLLFDPHPVVVARVLTNRRITEDDVLALVTRRPGSPVALREVSRAAGWAHRARVRRALVLNPATPEAVAMPLLALLVRSELLEVAAAPDLPDSLRQASRERLARLPPRGEDGAPGRQPSSSS